MQFKNHFRLSLFFPFLLAAVALIVGELSGYKAYAPIIFFLSYPIVIAGIPYTIFVVVTLYWSKSKSNDELKKHIWLLPFVFLPLLAIAPLIHGDPGTIGTFIETVAITWVAGIIYGYSYVLLAYCVWFIVSPTSNGHE